MNLSTARIRLAVIAFSAMAFLFFAVRDASKGGTDISEGLLYAFAIYGVPFAVFAFVVWSSSWNEAKVAEGGSAARSRIGLASEVMTALSSGLFVLTLPFTTLIAEHETLGESWFLTGLVTAILGAISAVAGSPRRWMHAVGSAVLLPCWIFLGALMVKMMMD